MKKKMNLTAIIAVAMVAMSVLVLGSCNVDDDYNEFDYGTLANGLVTRSGDYGWGSDGELVYRLNNHQIDVCFEESNNQLKGNATLDVQFSYDASKCFVSIGNFAMERNVPVNVVSSDVLKYLLYNNVCIIATLKATEIKENPSDENPDSMIYDTINYEYGLSHKIPLSQFTIIQ